MTGEKFILPAVEIFEEQIRKHYVERADEQVTEEVLEAVIELVTRRIHSDYQRFWKKYPKSRKRYSTLKLEDLDHPFIHYLITDMLIEKGVEPYREVAKALLNKTDEELDVYEISKKGYYEK